MLVFAAPAAVAQEGGEAAGIKLFPLFARSFDIFTIVLLLGSVVAAGVVVRTVLDIRTSKIAPKDSADRAQQLIASGRLSELKTFIEQDRTFIGAVLGAALAERDRGPDAVREAAEIEASSQTAAWFRKIELLSVIGNLGPLIGLAGTVWGMILAFTTLGETGGQAGPSDLSIGISKALFHTLLGLLLAIPCLLVFGIYRSAVDRICTNAIAQTARLTERMLRAFDTSESAAGETDRTNPFARREPEHGGADDHA